MRPQLPRDVARRRTAAGQRGTERGEKAGKQPIERAVADQDRAWHDQRGPQICLFDADLRCGGGQPGLGCEHVAAPPQEIGWPSNRRPRAVVGYCRFIIHGCGNGECAGRFSEQNCKRMLRFCPGDFDQAEPCLRLRQIGGRAAHVEIGRKPRLEPQSDDPEGLSLELGRFLEQCELRSGPAIFDILRGDRRGDQSALVRAQVVSLGIARSGKANLGTEAPGQVKVEPAKQTATRCPTRPIVIAFDADLRRTVDGRKAVALLGSQQRRGRKHPVACSADLEIGGKTARDQRFEHRIGESLPPGLV